MRFSTPMPLLDKPRPMATLVVGTTRSRDARWRNVPKKIRSINRTRLHERQLKAR